MDKGINLRIEELKTDLAKVINEANMPVSVSEMIVQNLLQEIHLVKMQQVEKEKQEFENIQDDNINDK